MNEVSYQAININNGFWADEQRINEHVTMWSVYERFRDSGRFDAACYKWKEGDRNRPHIFWDSDVAKWIEGVSYILYKKRDPGLEGIIDEVVDGIGKNRRKDGYFNSYFLAAEPEEVFRRRLDHELYCLGHFIEAALAYRDATGKDKLLKLTEDYVKLVDRTFRLDHSAGFDTPGHEEIELALGKLYRAEGKEEYAELLACLINTRGTSSRDGSLMPLFYTQSHAPVREQTEAVGHAVRALYLYSGMMELASITKDESLFKSCRVLFDDIVGNKLYITGGVGSTHAGEAFTFPYDLPGNTAYAETCASIALAMFCQKLWLWKPDTRYDDAAELAVYNTVLAGISLKGNEFFYENPLEVNLARSSYFSDKPEHLKERYPIYRRVELFDCSCCPPNLLRFFASIGDYMYSVEENTVYTHFYMGGDARILVDGKEMVLKQETEYPFDGKITIKVSGDGVFSLAVRIPGWCTQWSVIKDGILVEGRAGQDGYIKADGCMDGTVIEITLSIPPVLVEANPKVTSCCGRVAVMKGPVVYCAEGIDNRETSIFDMRLNTDTVWKEHEITVSGRRLPCLHTTAYARNGREELYSSVCGACCDSVPLVLIPYFSWGNRESSDMAVWLLRYN